MILTNEYLGTAELLSPDTLVASQPGTVHIRYTVGKYGIDENANIRLAWRSVSDWEMPQFSDPKAFGYTTIECNTKTDAKIQVTPTNYQRPFHNSILLKSRMGELLPGDVIDIRMGNTDFGSLGLRTQSFVENEHEILVLVDPFNINVFHELPERIKIKVVNGPMNEVQVVVPSYVNAKEEFAYTVRVVDEWGNPCTDFEGDIDISYLDANENAVKTEKVTFTKDDPGFKKVYGKTIDKEGTYYFKAVCEATELCGSSNVCICKDNREYNLYWGDMHAQTALTIGTGSLGDYYSFGKGPGALDFTGWQGNDLEITHKKWEEVRAKTKQYHVDNEFLVYLGFEWSGNSSGGGDHNVWFLGDSEEFWASSNWEVASEFKPEELSDCYPVTKLFDKVRDREDIMVIPHIGGRPANLDFYDEKIRNIEIHSHHGTFEWFAHDAMDRELKVGFVASSDDHTCRPGLSYALQNTGQEAAAFDTKSGLVGVYAKELSKEAIWEALQARRCFAATYNRMIVDVKVNDAFIGEEVELSAPPEISVMVAGDSPIDHIEVYRGNEIIHKHLNYNATKDEKIKKVRVLWSGVRNRFRSKSSKWDGSLMIDEGRIVSAEGVAFDTFQQDITYKSNQLISWKSSTSGDYDGVVMELLDAENATLTFSSKLASFSIKLSDLGKTPYVVNCGGENLKVEAVTQGETYGDTFAEKCHVELKVTDPDYNKGFGAYWVKAVQENGQMVFSSPIFTK